MAKDRPTVAKGETVCPACGGKLVPILYGLSSHEGFQASERGEVVLGGCLVTGDDPRLECRSCGADWWIE